MDPATDIEEFRRELHDYLTEMEDAMRLFSEIAAVRQKFDQAGLQPLALLAETKKRLSELKPEELSQMRASYAIFPNWREAPRSINSVIKPELRQMLESKIAARRKSGGAVMAGIPDDCAAALAAGITNSTNTIVNNDNANKTEVLNSLTLAKNEIINNDNSNTTMIINRSWAKNQMQGWSSSNALGLSC